MRWFTRRMMMGGSLRGKTHNGLVYSVSARVSVCFADLDKGRDA